MAKRAKVPGGLLDLAELQAEANQYARDTATRVDFKIGGLSEDAFQVAMAAILGAIVSAWAAGWAAGRESK
jgi:hypothetical protein